jgi:hypothetical protein
MTIPSSVAPRRMWYPAAYSGFTSWSEERSAPKGFPHLALLATLHVVSQPQPRFCHVQENQLVGKVNNFRAGIPIRNLAAGFDA